MHQHSTKAGLAICDTGALPSVHKAQSLKTPFCNLKQISDILFDFLL